jgi:hypothetical protein
VSEPMDWPQFADDLHNPFGPVPTGVMLCAYCAVANSNSAAPFWIIDPERPSRLLEVRSGAHMVLLGAAVQGYLIRDISGWTARFALAVSTVNGTSCCVVHVLDAMGKIR